MRLPNFFIVGAPKCGTTAMWHYLSGHPDVYMTEPKEPHYFNKDHHYRILREWPEYLQLYAGAPENARVLGEASVWYLYSNEAIREIRRMIPDAGILVMVRNPVDMVPSLHEQLCLSGREDVQDLQTAWRLQESRARGESLPRTCIEPLHLQYRRVCSLGTLLQRAFEVMPREQVMVTLFDDFTRDPGQEYRRVLEFLKIPDHGQDSFKVVNSARTVHSWRLNQAIRAVKSGWAARKVSFGTGLLGRLERANTVHRKRDRPPAAFQLELKEAFRHEIELLEDLLQRDLSAWKHVYEPSV